MADIQGNINVINQALQPTQPTPLVDTIGNGTIGNELSTLSILNKDTEERLNNLYNGLYTNYAPNPQNYIDKSNSQQNILDGNTESLREMLNSDDPDKSYWAQNQLAKISENNPKYDALNKGIGTNYFPYDKSMDKYLYASHGYDPYSSIQDNEQWYYDNVKMNQNWFKRVGLDISHFLLNVGEGVITKTGESFGLMGGMISSIFEDGPYWKNVSDNALVRQMETWDDQWKSRVLPIWHDKNFANKGFFSQMADEAFWAENFADGIAFTLQAIGMTMLTSGIGDATLGAIGLEGIGQTAIDTGSLLSKVIKYKNFADKAGKLINWGIRTATGAEDIAGIGNWALSVSNEAAWEAKGVFDETFIDLKNQGYNDDDASKLASQRAAHDFKGNLIALSVSNAFENKMIFQPFKKEFFGKHFGSEVEGLEGKNIKLSEFEDANKPSLASKEEYKTKFGKYTDWKNPYGKIQLYGKAFGGAAVMEGLYEENVQLAMERLSRFGEYDQGTNTMQDWGNTTNQWWKQVLNSIGLEYGGRNTWSDDVLSRNYTKIYNNMIASGKTSEEADKIASDTTAVKINPTTGLPDRDIKYDQEAMQSIGVGALSSILTIGAEKTFAGERKTLNKDVENNLKSFNDASRNFLGLRDVYKKDETGTPIKEDGKLVYDPAKLAGVAKGISDFFGQTYEANQVQDPILRNIWNNKLLSQLVGTATFGGFSDKLKQNLQSLSEKSSDDLIKMGFNPDETNMDVKDVLSTVNKFEDALNDAFNTRTSIPKGMSSNQWQSLNDTRRWKLYDIMSAKIAGEIAKDSYTNNNNEIREKLYSTLGLSVTTNSEVDDYNKLIFRRNALQQFDDYEKGTIQNNEFYKGFNEKEFNSLNKEIEQRKKILEPAFKELNLKENEYGILEHISGINSLYMDNIKRIAEMDNSNSRQQYEIDQLSDTRSGITNLEKYYDWIQQNNVVIKEANKRYTYKEKEYSKDELNTLFQNNEIEKDVYDKVLKNGTDITKEQQEKKTKFGQLLDRVKNSLLDKFKNIKNIFVKDDGTIGIEGENVTKEQETEINNKINNIEEKPQEEEESPVEITTDNNGDVKVKINEQKYHEGYSEHDIEFDQPSPENGTEVTNVNNFYNNQKNEKEHYPIIEESDIKKIDVNTEENSIGFINPNVTNTLDTTMNNEDGTETYISNEYNNSLRQFLKLIHSDPKAKWKYNAKILQDSANNADVYKAKGLNFETNEQGQFNFNNKGFSDAGQIVQFFKQDGTPLKIGDINERLAKSKLSNLPVIMSFGNFYITDGKIEKLAKSENITEDEAKNRLQEQINLQNKIREYVKSTGKSIPISIKSVTNGYHPMLNTNTQVAETFKGNDFTIDIIKENDMKNGKYAQTLGNENKPGAVIAIFHNPNGTNKPMLVYSPKIMQTILLNSIKELMNKTHEGTKEEIEKQTTPVIKMLSNFIYLNENRVLKINDRNSLSLYAYGKEIEDIGLQSLNIDSNTLQKGIETTLSPEKGEVGEDLIMTKEQYQEFLKNSMFTNRKKIFEKDKNGNENIYTAPLHQKLEFEIPQSSLNILNPSIKENVASESVKNVNSAISKLESRIVEVMSDDKLSTEDKILTLNKHKEWINKNREVIINNVGEQRINTIEEITNKNLEKLQKQQPITENKEKNNSLYENLIERLKNVRSIFESGNYVLILNSKKEHLSKEEYKKLEKLLDEKVNELKGGIKKDLSNTKNRLEERKKTLEKNQQQKVNDNSPILGNKVGNSYIDKSGNVVIDNIICTKEFIKKYPSKYLQTLLSLLYQNEQYIQYNQFNITEDIEGIDIDKNNEWSDNTKLIGQLSTFNLPNSKFEMIFKNEKGTEYIGNLTDEEIKQRFPNQEEKIIEFKKINCK